jgi:hypothetical protein
MPEQKAIAFFKAVSVGTPVVVFGSMPRMGRYQAAYSGQEPDDNRRYYQRFYNDPSYYRGRVLTPPPFGFWPF